MGSKWRRYANYYNAADPKWINRLRAGMRAQTALSKAILKQLQEIRRGKT